MSFIVKFSFPFSVHGLHWVKRPPMWLHSAPVPALHFNLTSPQADTKSYGEDTWSERWPTLGRAGTLRGPPAATQCFSVGLAGELRGPLGHCTQRGGMSRRPPALRSSPDCLSYGRHLTPGCTFPRSPHPTTGCGWEWMVCASRPMGTTLKTTPVPQLPVGSAKAIAEISLQSPRPLWKNLIISFKERFSRARIRHWELSVDVALARDEKELNTSCLGCRWTQGRGYWHGLISDISGALCTDLGRGAVWPRSPASTAMARLTPLAFRKPSSLKIRTFILQFKYRSLHLQS